MIQSLHTDLCRRESLAPVHFLVLIPLTFGRLATLGSILLHRNRRSFHLVILVILLQGTAQAYVQYVQRIIISTATILVNACKLIDFRVMVSSVALLNLLAYIVILFVDIIRRCFLFKTLKLGHRGRHCMCKLIFRDTTSTTGIQIIISAVLWTQKTNL